MLHRLICCLLICCSRPALADERARDILRKLADSFVQAGDSYEIQVRVGKTYEDDDIRTRIATDCTLQRSLNRFRYETGSGKNDVSSRFVTDWTDIWEHLPNWKQYTEGRVSSQRGARLLKTVRGADFDFLGRFLLLSKPGFTANYEGTAAVKTRDGKHMCDIVRVFPESVQERSWEDRLWIDSSTGLV